MILPQKIFNDSPSFQQNKLRNNFFEIRFNSEVNTFNSKNDNVYLLFKDSKKKSKACILVHGLGMEIDSKWDKYLHIIPETMGACYIDLPYQRHRKTERNLLSSFTDGIFTLNFFKQGTFDIIKTVSILKSLGYREIFIIGISLGSLFSIMSMGLDKRIKKGVLILSGGDYGILTWKSPVLHQVRENYKKENITRASCLKAREIFPSFIESVKKGENPLNIKSNIICPYFDPISFAPLIEPENVLMINAIFDLIIPRKSTVSLHRALGKPRIIWLPTGHLSLHIFQKRIITYIKSFLR